MHSVSRWRVWHVVAGAALVLAAQSACGSKPSPTAAPVSPTAIANATGVTLGFAAPRTGSIKPTDLLQLRATASFADGSTGDCTEASTWTSSNEQVLRISATRRGDVVAIGGGEAKVTATCGPFAADLPLTVLGISKVTATLPAGTTNGLIIGQRLQLSSSVTFSDGTTDDCTASAAWSSSNAAVVSVAAGGALAAVGPGNADVTSTCRAVSAALPVSVRPGLRITGLEGQPFVLRIRPKLTLRADVVDAAGNVVRSCDDATWTSSNPQVLTLRASTVGSGFEIIPGQEGEALVTTSCGDHAAITPVRVGHYNLVGTLRSRTGAPVAGARIHMTQVSSSSSLDWVTETFSNSNGEYSLPLDVSPAAVTITGPGLPPQIFPLFTWDRQPTMTFDTKIPRDVVVAEVSGKVCNSNPVPDPVGCTTSPPSPAGPEYRVTIQIPWNGQLRLDITPDSTLPADAALEYAFFCTADALPPSSVSDRVILWEVTGPCPNRYLRVKNLTGKYPQVAFRFKATMQ